MPAIAEKVGARVYATGAPFGLKNRLKSLGCHWDADRRAWWIGAAKKAELEALLAGADAPAYLVTTATEGSRAVAESLGLKSDTPAAIVADALQEKTGDEKAAANIRAGKTAQQDPHEIRLTGKGRYKGREYYAGSITKDGTKVRLLTLPDATGKYLDFWALCSEVTETKTYSPREVWDGRRYSGRTRTEYTTLGSIADFIRRQKNPATRRIQCPECDSWHDAGEACHDCGGC